MIAGNSCVKACIADSQHGRLIHSTTVLSISGTCPVWRATNSRFPEFVPVSPPRMSSGTECGILLAEPIQCCQSPSFRANKACAVPWFRRVHCSIWGPRELARAPICGSTA